MSRTNQVEDKNKCENDNIYSEPDGTLPIKIVANNNTKLQSNKVKIGRGLTTSIVALPHFLYKDKQKRRVYRVLLDSGSDGDILFARVGTDECVPCKRRISPQKWRTSNGTFSTEKVGDDLEFSFPEFNESKRVKIRPDIVELPTSAPQPAYDIIIGCETLSQLGCVLNFDDNTITIDQHKLPMRSHNSLRDTKKLNMQFKPLLEPKSTRDATSRTVQILDAKYEKADLPSIIAEHCKHLTVHQRNKLLRLLLKFETLFDGTLRDWKTEPVSFTLKPGTKPYHGRAFPVPHIHLATLKKEVERLVKIGVLKKQPTSEWASPTFIIPKTNQTVRFLSDFREVNKRIVRTPYPIPKVSSMLQEMEGFTYATALDLNMGYYTIRLDPDAQKICTIILPWGKYSYLCLPMGVACSPDIFQE